MKKLASIWVLFGLLMAIPASRAVAQESRPATIASGEASTPAGQSGKVDQSEADEDAIYRKSPMVRKMGAMMGMNANQSATVFEVVNFLILAVLLGWFLLKALPKTFRNRNTTIQKHLVDARTATEEANARLGSVEDRLSKLDGIIAELRAQSEKDAIAEEQRIKASAEDEKAKILAAAEQEIAAAMVQARRELQKYAAELAIEQAGHKLVVNAETDRLLVQAFAHRLSQGKEGQN